ncbi:hypothetical protein [Microbacterium sp.]|uniref:hypothetical protein n=1 Tax=Microbacterium sp. TaxID=51671 RepID=UPI001AC0BE06|nr:hypothetical protein [Microbacterium sp.]MBN9186800.1 hypothetical protein [Microbacterium sp.]MBN9194052.1 hypothetical protein [Microbacterium sp.]
MRKKIAAAVVLSLGLFGPGIQPASAAPPSIRADIEILRTASLSADGSAVTVRVRSLCADDGTVWESYITAQQDAVFAYADPMLVCDGRRHVQTVTLDVIAPPGQRLKRGTIEVDARIVDEATLTPVATDVATVRVRCLPRVH